MLNPNPQTQQEMLPKEMVPKPRMIYAAQANQFPIRNPSGVVKSRGVCKSRGLFSFL